MDWKESFKKVEEEERRIRERKENEERMWEESVQRAKKISPQIKEVFDIFVKSLPPWTVKEKYSNISNSRYFLVGLYNGICVCVDVHPLCPACAKDIIGGDYIKIGVIEYGVWSGKIFVPEKIKLKYPIAHSFSHGIEYKERYNHYEAEFIKISFKDFTKEKLAEVLIDIYVGIRQETEEGRRSA